MHTYFQVQVVDFKDHFFKKEHKIDYKEVFTAGIGLIVKEKWDDEN